MIERHAGDADTAIAHAGKIGQTQPTRRVLLPEDDVLLGPVERPPGADATLQCTPDAGAELGMAPPDLVKDGDRPQAGNALEQLQRDKQDERSASIKMRMSPDA